MIDLSMNKSLLLGALCACTFGFMIAPVRAQNTAVAPAQNATTKSGYDLLLEAQTLLKVDGPNGEPTAAEKLAPDENLRRQRLAVARNAPALAKLRAALKAGIITPPDIATDMAGNFRIYASAREMARQLYQEAAVAAADSDAMGAAQSDLTTLQLGAQTSRGSIIQELVGVAISAIARKSFAQHAALLNAAQSREVAQQWQQISDTMPTYAEVLRGEEKSQLVFMRQNMGDFNDPKQRAQVQAELDKGKLDEDQAKMARQMLALSPAEIEADFHTIFDKSVERAGTPYFVAIKAVPIKGGNSVTDITADMLNGPALRFSVERDIIANRLIVATLKLHATKLESGAYPQTFDAGVDSFSPTLAPLIYKRAGDSYVLYSVGPDGKDDNGAEIQTLTTNKETGVKSVTDRLTPDSTGDIVAPVL